MNLQGSGGPAKGEGRAQGFTKTEPLALLAQPRQRRARQGVERAAAGPAAVALQPTDVAMPVKLGALGTAGSSAAQSRWTTQ